MRLIAKNTIITIRPFQINDRSALFKIAADSSFFGEPIEHYFEDRNIFLDMLYRYYTDHEPEHAWIAEADQQVVGFLTGCFDTKAKQALSKRKILPQFLSKFIRGKYKPGKKAWQYAIRLGLAKLRKERPKIDLAVYPAHLHINLDKDWRGYGIGQRLIQAYLDQLIYHQIPGVHLSTTSEHKAACKLYERMGFVLLDKRKSSLWRGFIDHRVENRIYGLKLPTV